VGKKSIPPKSLSLNEYPFVYAGLPGWSQCWRDSSPVGFKSQLWAFISCDQTCFIISVWDSKPLALFRFSPAAHTDNSTWHALIFLSKAETENESWTLFWQTK
jgi:hypothetical protein